MKVQFKAIAFAAATLVLGHAAWAGEAEAKKWIDSEFQPSTLNKDQQMAEMKWFIDAAARQIWPNWSSAASARTVSSGVITRAGLPPRRRNRPRRNCPRRSCTGTSSLRRRRSIHGWCRRERRRCRQPRAGTWPRQGARPRSRRGHGWSRRSPDDDARPLVDGLLLRRRLLLFHFHYFKF